MLVIRFIIVEIYFVTTRVKMCIFNYIFLASFFVFLIAHPIDNDLSNQNDESIKDSSPPMEFPQNDSQFPVVATNATLLHELSGDEDNVATQESEQIEKDNIKAEEINENNNPKPEVDGAGVRIDSPESEIKSQEADESKIDTEVPDLLKIDEALIEPPQEPESNAIPDISNDNDSVENHAQAQQEHIPNEPVNSVINTSTEDYPKAEVEWIQNGHDNEDVRLLADDDTSAPSSDYIREAYSEHGRGVPLVQGRYAAILAGVFIVLAVVGYAVMLSWRRYLENRYGNRQMLINEDDIYTENDLKHFSL